MSASSQEKYSLSRAGSSKSAGPASRGATGGGGGSRNANVGVTLSPKGQVERYLELPAEVVVALQERARAAVGEAHGALPDVLDACGVVAGHVVDHGECEVEERAALVFGVRHVVGEPQAECGVFARGAALRGGDGAGARRDPPRARGGREAAPRAVGSRWARGAGRVPRGWAVRAGAAPAACLGRVGVPAGRAWGAAVLPREEAAYAVPQREGRWAEAAFHARRARHGEVARVGAWRGGAAGAVVPGGAGGAESGGGRVVCGRVGLVAVAAHALVRAARALRGGGRLGGARDHDAVQAALAVRAAYARDAEPVRVVREAGLACAALGDVARLVPTGAEHGVWRARDGLLAAAHVVFGARGAVALRGGGGRVVVARVAAARGGACGVGRVRGAEVVAAAAGGVGGAVGGGGALAALGGVACGVEVVPFVAHAVGDTDGARGRVRDALRALRALHAHGRRAGVVHVRAAGADAGLPADGAGADGDRAPGADGAVEVFAAVVVAFVAHAACGDAGRALEAEGARLWGARLRCGHARGGAGGVYAAGDGLVDVACGAGAVVAGLARAARGVAVPRA
eukprot:858907-Rhodomonas_salina.1